jgi:hypothetical protein
MKKMFLVFVSLLFTTSLFAAINLVENDYKDVVKKANDPSFSPCLKARYAQKLAFIETFKKDSKKVADLEATVKEVCKNKTKVATVTRDGKSQDIYYVMYTQKTEPKECTTSPDTKEEHAKGKSWYITDYNCKNL